MMTEVLLVILYLIILPIALGIVSNYVLRRGNSLGERRLVTRLLDDYVSGFVVMFLAFEVAGLFILNTAVSLSEFIETMTGYINVFLLVSLVVAIIVIIVAAILKGVKGKLTDEIKSLRPIKSDIIVIVFFAGYVLLSLLFILTSLKDDTFLNIIVMQKEDVIGTVDTINGKILSNINGNLVNGNVKLIEVFYLVLANITGIDSVQLITIPINISFLILFFGVYKRIEWIFFGYNKKLAKYKKWTECLFMGICIVLLFIDGSLNVAVPQNIWNGTTILSSIIMPLCFIYGYAAVCEVCNGKLLRTAIWLILIVFMLPVASLMSNSGYRSVAILGAVVVLSIIVVAIVNVIKGNDKGKNSI